MTPYAAIPKRACVLQVFQKWNLSLAQFKAQPVWRQRMQKQTVGLF